MPLSQSGMTGSVLRGHSLSRKFNKKSLKTTTTL